MPGALATAGEATMQVRAAIGFSVRPPASSPSYLAREECVPFCSIVYRPDRDFGASWDSKTRKRDRHFGKLTAGFWRDQRRPPGLSPTMQYSTDVLECRVPTRCCGLDW